MCFRVFVLLLVGESGFSATSLKIAPKDAWREQESLTFNVFVDKYSFSPDAQVEWKRSPSDSFQARSASLRANGSLDAVLISNDVASVTRGTIRVTDGAKVFTGEINVKPKCGDIIGQTTGPSGQTIYAYSNGPKTGSSKLGCGADAVPQLKGIDGTFGYHCKELVKRYYKDVLGASYNAADWTGSNLEFLKQEKYEKLGLIKLDNDGTGKPKVGDLIVFSKDNYTDAKGVEHIDNVGHVAIVIAMEVKETIGDITKYDVTVLEQNWSLSGYAHLVLEHNSKLETYHLERSMPVRAWLRAANPPSTTPPPTGTVTVNGTLDGVPLWRGSLLCQLLGSVSNSISTVPSLLTLPARQYTLGCSSLPGTLQTVRPSASQQLSAGGSVEFRLEMCSASTNLLTGGLQTDGQKSTLGLRAASGCPNTGPDPLFAGCSCSPAIVAIGQSTTCSAEESGGTGAFQYSWQSEGLPIGTAQTASVAFPSSGSKSVVLSVIDTGSPGQKRTTSCGVQVTTAPVLSGSCAISPNPLILGQGATVTANASGGVPPYQYRMGYGGLFGNINSVAVLPGAVGTFSFSGVVVKDSLGQVSPASCSVQVLPALSASCQVNGSSEPITVNAGTHLNYAVGSSGGITPYHYSWHGVSGAGDTSSITVTPIGLASIDVSATVTDSSSPAASTTASCPRVTINPPLTASCSISPNPLVLGQGGTVSASGTGGVPPYQYQMIAGGAFSSVNSVGIMPSAVGTFTYSSVAVRDSAGQTATSSCSAPVNPAPLQASCQVNGSSSPIVVYSGTGLNYTTATSGGIAPYHYSWIGVSGAGDNSSISVVPSGLSSIDVSVQVRDSYSPAASTTASCPRVTITPLLTASCSISPNPVPWGQGATVYASGTGGVPPYEYRMSPDLSFGAVNQIAVMPPAPGTFTYSGVTVRDSQGHTATASCSAEASSPPPLTVNCYFSPNPVNLGNGTTLYASASGGTGGYLYSLNGSAFGSTSTALYYPQTVGSFSIGVSAQDSWGTVKSTSCSATVNGVPPTITGYSWYSQPRNRVNFSGYVEGSGFVSSSAVYFCVSGTSTCYQHGGVTIYGLNSMGLSNVNLTTGSWQVEVRTPYGSARSGSFSVTP